MASQLLLSFSGDCANILGSLKKLYPDKLGDDTQSLESKERHIIRLYLTGWSDEIFREASSTIEAEDWDSLSHCIICTRATIHLRSTTGTETSYQSLLEKAKTFSNSGQAREEVQIFTNKPPSRSRSC